MQYKEVGAKDKKVVGTLEGKLEGAKDALGASDGSKEGTLEGAKDALGEFDGDSD